MPQNYFSFEPYRTFLNYSFPTEDSSKSVQFTFISDLLKCKFDKYETYVSNEHIFENNVKFEYSLLYGNGLQYLSAYGPFLAFMCKRANFHIIKTVAVKLKDLTKFIEDFEENIFVIHLLRDPRAMVDSIRRIPNGRTSFSTYYFCNNIRMDLRTSETFKKKYLKR